VSESDAIAALVERLAAALTARGATMAAAESCTGGLVAAACTSRAGSSAWFERGVVTYSNAAKSELLAVPPALIAEHGAVSAEVARAMAAGALTRSPAGFAVAITGIAGPDGGTAQKPVGMLCFAWARKERAVKSETRRFAGDREAVRRQSVEHALRGVLKALDAG